METFSVLLNQHEKLKSLMSSIESLIEKAPNNIEPINKKFQKFKAQFSLYDEIEDKVLYKRLIEIPGLRELSLKAQHAHHAIKTILFELRILTFASEHWLPKFLVLKDHLMAHMKEEEEVIFKKAEANMSENELEALATALQNFANKK